MVDAGGPVHLADFGGEGTRFLLLHGLGGSHLNWVRLGPLLARHGRVLAPDLAGFGKTPPAGRATTLPANAELVDRLLAEVVGGPAILVGNSMGGLIALLEASARPERVAGLVLLDPAVPLAPGVPRDRQVTMAFTAYMVPGIGELFLRGRRRRLGAEGMVRETFRLSCVDPSRVPEEVIQEHVHLVRDRMRMPWADAAVLRAARSLVTLILRRRRFLQMAGRVQVPTLLVQGEHDRLIQVGAARLMARLHPRWTLRTLPDVGHIPHLEAPEDTAAAILGWLAGPGREAATRATPAPAPLPNR